jgi:hypothetical protein
MRGPRRRDILAIHRVRLGIVGIVESFVALTRARKRVDLVVGFESGPLDHPKRELVST